MGDLAPVRAPVRGPARGQVLRPPFTPVRAPAPAGTRGWGKVAALVLLLPMFFQMFQYMIDVWPLYNLSKVWPLLTLPLALWGIVSLRLPYTIFFVVVLAYVVGGSSAISMLQLYNSFPEAIATTAKVWSFSFYFSFSAVLHWLRPTPEQLRRAMLLVSAGIFVAFWVLWLGVPAGSYRSDPTLTQVFYVENERGYRIVLPIGLGLVGIFFVARSLARAPRWWHLVLLVAAYATLVSIFKQRIAIGFSFMITAFVATSGLRARLPALSWALVLGGAALVPLALFLLPDRLLGDTLGGSLSIRQTSAELAWKFIGDDPIRLLFGVGSTTNFSTVTLQSILGFAMFYITDLGWLGVLMEYGVLGAAMIGVVYLLGNVLARQAARNRDPLMQALADWAAYLVLVTVVYSVIYTPGEISSVAAIAVYTMRWTPPQAAFRGRSA